jgi:hypothetical protein
VIAAPQRLPTQVSAGLTRCGEDQVAFEAEGEILRIVSSLPGVIAALRELGYPPKGDGTAAGIETAYRIRAEGGSRQPVFLIEHNQQVVLRTREQDLVVRYLIAAIRGFISEKRGGELHVHAGAVSFDGLGIMLPAESRRGKSTLTLALLLKGCRYLSDEVALLEQSTFALVPTGKHLLLRRQAYSLFPHLEETLAARTYRWHPHAEERAFLPLEVVGDGLLSAPCRLGLIIFPHFQAGTAVHCQPLERGTAGRALLRHCQNLRWRTPELIDMAIQAVQQVDALALTFGDAFQAADRILAEARTRGCQQTARIVDQGENHGQ